jgi:hypothetical protein
VDEVGIFMTKVFDDRVPIGDCDFSVIDQPLDSAAEVLGYYDHFRANVQHEESLNSSRLTWSLTVHGFLFAAYGILLAKIADIFIELHRNLGSSALLGHVVTALLLFQIPVAAFGIRANA